MMLVILITLQRGDSKPREGARLSKSAHVGLRNVKPAAAILPFREKVMAKKPDKREVCEKLLTLRLKHAKVFSAIDGLKAELIVLAGAEGFREVFRRPGSGDALVDHLINLLTELGDLKGTLGNTNGKIDTFIRQLGEHDKRTTEIEVRLRRVENRQHWYSEVAAAIGAAFGFGGAHSLTH
jgi:hypothetical protein